MNIMKQGWFSEMNDLWPGVALSLEVTQILHQERSEYQDILVVKTYVPINVVLLNVL